MPADLSPTLIAVLLVGGYLLGSIPFGILVMRAAGAGDPRAIGSGNIGATNVLRSGRKGLALATLLGDGGKGALAVLAAFLATRQASLPAQAWATSIAGGAAFFGHLFPVWLKFKGGKGVATSLGMLLALAPWVGATACLTWLAMALIFKFSSLAALAAFLIAPLAANFIYHDATLAGVCSFIALLVWVKHRANIKRLAAGEEPRIGKKKDAA